MKDVVAMSCDRSSPTRERAMLRDASVMLEVRVLNDGLPSQSAFTPSLLSEMGWLGALDL